MPRRGAVRIRPEADTADATEDTFLVRLATLLSIQAFLSFRQPLSERKDEYEVADVRPCVVCAGQVVRASRVSNSVLHLITERFLCIYSIFYFKVSVANTSWYISFYACYSASLCS